MLIRDVELDEQNISKDFLIKKHISFLHNYAQNKDNYEQLMVEYLKMSGIYWTITALKLVDNPIEDGLFANSIAARF